MSRGPQQIASIEHPICFGRTRPKRLLNLINNRCVAWPLIPAIRKNSKARYEHMVTAQNQVTARDDSTSQFLYPNRRPKRPPVSSSSVSRVGFT